MSGKVLAVHGHGLAHVATREFRLLAESVSGTVFCSRVCLMRSDLHNEIQAGVACTKGLGRVDPYALSVVSG